MSDDIDDDDTDDKIRYTFIVPQWGKLGWWWCFSPPNFLFFFKSSALIDQCMASKDSNFSIAMIPHTIPGNSWPCPKLFVFFINWIKSCNLLSIQAFLSLYLIQFRCNDAWDWPFSSLHLLSFSSVATLLAAMTRNCTCVVFILTAGG